LQLRVIAAVNSGLAVYIAIQTATTRVLSDMGRVKALQPILAKVDPHWKTPPRSSGLRTD